MNIEAKQREKQENSILLNKNNTVELRILGRKNTDTDVDVQDTK